MASELILFFSYLSVWSKLGQKVTGSEGDKPNVSFSCLAFLSSRKVNCLGLAIKKDGF